MFTLKKIVTSSFSLKCYLLGSCQIGISTSFNECGDKQKHIWGRGRERGGGEGREGRWRGRGWAAREPRGRLGSYREEVLGLIVSLLHSFLNRSEKVKNLLLHQTT